jgi:hydroxymethylpyrimidine/phosphomethylpyrimidine kinase
MKSAFCLLVTFTFLGCLADTADELDHGAADSSVASTEEAITRTPLADTPNTLGAGCNLATGGACTAAAAATIGTGLSVAVALEMCTYQLQEHCVENQCSP